MGEHIKAVDAYAKAIDCNPRQTSCTPSWRPVCSTWPLCRCAPRNPATVAPGRANFTLYTLITQLDFIEDRWPDAIDNARIAATEAPTDEQAAYWQCFLWLAQLHAGTPEPRLVKRRTTEAWPTPILESLQGRITEDELVEAVEEEHDENRQRDILSEALFYTGQRRLANNQVDAAVKYFTATVDLKVLYFIEHQLARAELEKLRPRDAVDQNSKTPLM